MGTEAEATATLGEDRSEWPEVAIIVLNWNNYEDTAECLKSIEKVKYPNYQVIVADNGSTDGSGKRLESEFDWCTFLFIDENLGFSGGNNVAISHALENNYDYVLLLNNDTIVAPNFLNPLVKTAEGHGENTLVSGLIYEHGTSDIWYAGGKFSPTLVKGTFRTEPKSNGTYEVGKITGALALIPASFAERFDVLNDDYFVGTEDAELGWLARSNGGKILLNPDSEVSHKTSSTRGMDNKFTHYNNSFNRLAFSSNNHDLYRKTLFILFFTTTLAMKIIRWAPLRKYGLIHSSLLGVYDFIMGNDPKDRISLLNQ